MAENKDGMSDRDVLLLLGQLHGQMTSVVSGVSDLKKEVVASRVDNRNALEGVARRVEKLEHRRSFEQGVLYISALLIAAAWAKIADVLSFFRG